MSDAVAKPSEEAPIAREGVGARRPPWMRIKVQNTETYNDVKKLIGDLKLNTVCEEARCPNIWECWGEHKTATFMILGEVCTRNCRYCSVISGRPKNLPDPKEPGNVAEAISRLGISHAVLTSVDRDDLPDYGAYHFVDTINAIRERKPGTKIEVLIPDFMGDHASLKKVLDARPEVLNHNTETVPRLYKAMRSKGIYARCLELLARADAYRKGDNHEGKPVAMTTKTGVIVGLGETFDELLLVMDDLRKAECDVLTMGQYLNPTKKHAPIARFYTPDEFYKLKEEGLKRGFKHVESGPLVRSSYHAHSHMPGAASTSV